jgi:phytoene dehydrogenase-like protein
MSAEPAVREIPEPRRSLAELARTIPERVEVAVVGGGLAGLCAARRLARAGREVHLFDLNREPGGRVRSNLVEGHRLDLGFQVLLTGYPAVQEELDIKALKPYPFEPGCVIVRDARHYSLPDPFRTPGRWLQALDFPLASLSDKLKTRALRQRLRREETAAIFAAPEKMAADALRDFGFTERFLSTFWIPFFSAVFLDPPLEVTTRMFNFVFRCIALGDIVLPSEGMGAIGRQMAAGLPEGRYHPATWVRSLRLENGRVTGLSVSTEDRPEEVRVIHADTVILAAGPEEARRLAKLEAPPLEPLGVSVVYFSTESTVTTERRIFFNGGGSSPAHHVVFLSNICPQYAPAGSQLISVMILGTPEGEGSALAERVRRQMAIWYPNGDTSRWHWLATYKIPLAQFRQPPGLLDRLPKAQTPIAGLFLAGDYTRNSSLQGALESGQIAAQFVLGEA